MPRQSKLTDDGENRLFGDLIGQLYIKIRVHLFKSADVITDSTVIATLVEADYPGYAYQELDPISPGSAADGFAGITGNKSFSGTYVASFPGNTGSDQTVYGIWVEGYDGISVYPFFASNCFDTNPAAALDGRVVSGPSDEVVVNIKLYLWDYFKNRDQNGKMFFFQQAPEEFSVPGADYTLSFYLYDVTNFWITDSGGTVSFSSTDPSDSWYVNPQTWSGDNGQMSLSLGTAGNRIITVTDTNDPTIQGTVGLHVHF